MTIEGDAPTDGLPRAMALSANGSVLAVSSFEFAKQPAAAFGYAKVFDLVNGAWLQRGATFRGAQGLQLLGISVALSADGLVLAIGSDRSPTNEPQGWVDVYAWDGTAWQHRASLTLVNNIQFGKTIALSADGSKVVIASDSNLAGDGRKILTYVWDGMNYGSTDPIVGQGSLALGSEAWMSADGLNMIAKAIDQSSPSTNAVLWYTWEEGLGWVLRDEVARLAAFSGITCSISADGTAISIAVGRTSIFGNSNGEVYVYKRSGSVWSQRGATIVGRMPDSFLSRAALSGNGDLVLVGGSNDSSGNGYAAVYGWDGAAWIQRGDLFEGSNGALLGEKIALSANGSTVGIGSPGEEGGYSASPVGRLRTYRGA